MRGTLRLYAAGLAALLLVVGLSYAGLRWWQRHEEKAWAEAFEPIDAILARHPRTEANDTARRLVSLGRSLGIALEGPAGSTPERQALSGFLTAHNSATSDEPVLPPPNVRAYLEEHREALTAVEALLVDADAPIWPSDLARGFSAPIAPVAGLIQVHGVLAADALEAVREGRPLDLERRLVAIERLHVGLQDGPDELSQLGALSMAGTRDTLVRRGLRDPGAWATKGNAHDFRRSLTAAVEVHAHLWRTMSDWKLGPKGPAEEAQPVGPFDRLCLLDLATRMRWLTQDVRSVDPCRLGTPEWQVRGVPAVPFWNVIGRVAMPSYRLWLQVGSAELGGELTRLVLEARVQPPERADTVASRVCGGLAWKRTPDGAGGTRIEAADASLPERPHEAPWRYHVQRR